MQPGSPEILTITRDIALARAVADAAPEAWTTWTETVGSALAAINPHVQVMVFDADVDGPLSRLLPVLFVDRQPGRRAVVIRARDGQPMPLRDERISVLSWPAHQDALAAAIAGRMVEPVAAVAVA